MALLPEFCRLDKGEEDFDRARTVHLLADDGLHLADGPKAQREIRIDTGCKFPDHPGSQHELVAWNLCLRRYLFKGGK
jgi:hypothetical protein